MKFFGAGDEARTRYLDLGKVALYQMSYTRISMCFHSATCYIIHDPFLKVNTFLEFFQVFLLPLKAYTLRGKRSIIRYP